jgi:DNA-binding MarR family transcriptional regulator
MSKQRKSDTSDLSRLLSIDKVIHEPARFMILAYLSAVESADFIFLLNQTGLTQGNLSLSITDKGRKALKEHLKIMKGLIDSLFGSY